MQLQRNVKLTYYVYHDSVVKLNSCVHVFIVREYFLPQNRQNYRFSHTAAETAIASSASRIRHTTTSHGITSRHDNIITS